MTDTSHPAHGRTASTAALHPRRAGRLLSCILCIHALATAPDGAPRSTPDVASLVKAPRVSSQGDALALFAKASPIHVADRITIPVLIAGGRNDPRVPITQSYHLAHAMRKAGSRPETYFKIDEAHGFWYERNRSWYDERVLEFLAERVKETK